MDVVVESKMMKNEPATPPTAADHGLPSSIHMKPEQSSCESISNCDETCSTTHATLEDLVSLHSVEAFTVYAINTSTDEEEEESNAVHLSTFTPLTTTHKDANETRHAVSVSSLQASFAERTVQEMHEILHWWDAAKHESPHPQNSLVYDEHEDGEHGSFVENELAHLLKDWTSSAHHQALVNEGGFGGGVCKLCRASLVSEEQPCSASTKFEAVMNECLVWLDSAPRNWLDMYLCIQQVFFRKGRRLMLGLLALGWLFALISVAYILTSSTQKQWNQSASSLVCYPQMDYSHVIVEYIPSQSADLNWIF
ncbi:hypothetical protein MPSEU_000418000 [Mayamaea pseudoterrestris]|nr:hypothetical protein MPSEU_000418000 [Mayamaea pseudoterrestris]GKY94523.1 hypothetical protein MPSEU_000418000 [Mayamaea pseudoterrestris]